VISPKDFVRALKKMGFRSFTGVPCSFFQAATRFVIDDPDLHYTIVPNEGSALALAAGAYLAGESTVLFIQNSGFGNLVNPLTSLNMIYRIPVLIFMSGRAYGVPDEPQHEIIGKSMGPLLDTLGLPHQDLPGEFSIYEKALRDAKGRMEKEKIPFVFFVKKGSMDESAPARNGKTNYPLKRIEAIRLISETLKGDEFIIATTGKPSRELFSVFDRKKNFYMQGSMGHAASIGLGIAIHRPQKKVIILDGDGALLMHMGILSSVGHEKPENFYHIVLDNESYESTGDQDTTSSSTDFKAAALSCGYAWAEEARSGEDLKLRLKQMLEIPGPCFLRVKINRLPTEGIARISSRYDSPKMAENFKAGLCGD